MYDVVGLQGKYQSVSIIYWEKRADSCTKNKIYRISESHEITLKVCAGVQELN